MGQHTKSWICYSYNTSIDCYFALPCLASPTGRHELKGNECTRPPAQVTAAAWILLEDERHRPDIKTILGNKMSGCASDGLGFALYVNEWEKNDGQLWLEWGDGINGCNKVFTVWNSPHAYTCIVGIVWYIFYLFNYYQYWSMTMASYAFFIPYNSCTLLLDPRTRCVRGARHLRHAHEDYTIFQGGLLEHKSWPTCDKRTSLCLSTSLSLCLSVSPPLCFSVSPSLCLSQLSLSLSHHLWRTVQNGTAPFTSQGSQGTVGSCGDPDRWRGGRYFHGRKVREVYIWEQATRQSCRIHGEWRGEGKKKRISKTPQSGKVGSVWTSVSIDSVGENSR